MHRTQQSAPSHERRGPALSGTPLIDPTTPTRQPLGFRLPASQIPAVAWCPWRVVTRTNGFHVSRESASGQHVEHLKNEVGGLKVFRSELKARRACEAANFDATAARLADEPLLSGKGRAA